MVFRLFFSEPTAATALTPKQKLESKAFPIEQLPDVFKSIIDAKPGSAFNNRIQHLFNQYVDLQIQLSDLQPTNGESTSTEIQVKTIDKIHDIVSQAEKLSLDDNRGFGALVDSAKKEPETQQTPASYQHN